MGETNAIQEQFRTARNGQEESALHGQDIYREAFNSAWEKYKDLSMRKGNESREEVSHKVAWSAVEKIFQKNSDGKWVKKQD